MPTGRRGGRSGICASAFRNAIKLARSVAVVVVVVVVAAAAKRAIINDATS